MELTGSIKLLCLPPVDAVDAGWENGKQRGHFSTTEWRNELRIQVSVTLVLDGSKPMIS